MRAVNTVKVRFAGLFDTVSTYGVGTVVGAADNVETLKLDAVTHAEKVLHLTSADEHRFHFSLTDIRNAMGAGTGSEYCLPGVHSDIGGGYREFGDEKLTLRGRSGPWGIILHGNHAPLEEVERDRRELIDAGWYTEDELPFKPVAGAEADYGQLTTQRFGIKGYYSKIPLNIMAKEMQGQGFTFRKVMANDEKIPDTEPELQKVQPKLESHATGASKTDPDRWRANREPWLKTLRHDYLHFSARMQPGHDPRIEKGRRQREKYPG